MHLLITVRSVLILLGFRDLTLYYFICVCCWQSLWIFVQFNSYGVCVCFVKNIYEPPLFFGVSNSHDIDTIGGAYWLNGCFICIVHSTVVSAL